MNARISAGLLMYRTCSSRLEVFLAHPGGPFFANKDAGHWTIPKGEIRNGEDLLATARREFEEETGLRPESDQFIPLEWIRQRGGKIVHAWAFPGDWPQGRPLHSAPFRMEWPPLSGQFHEYPEIDRVAFFPVPAALRQIKDTQRPFIRRLQAALAHPARL